MVEIYIYIERENYLLDKTKNYNWGQPLCNETWAPQLCLLVFMCMQM